MKKTDIVADYLQKMSVDGEVPLTADNIAKTFKVSGSLVRMVSKKLNIRLLKKERVYKNKTSDAYAKIALEMMEENPHITISEIGKTLGVSKQRISQILRSQGVEKQRPCMYNQSFSRVARIISETTKDPECSLHKFADRCGIGYYTLMRYMQLNKEDSEVKRFLSYFKRETKTSSIRYYLAYTSFSITAISEICHVAPQNVCAVNRRYDIRPRRKRKLKEMEPDMEME